MTRALTEKEKAVYAMLCDAANRGAPCPSNGQLYGVTGNPTPLLRRLESLGHIRIILDEGVRVGVEIVATGKSTAIASRFSNKGFAARMKVILNERLDLNDRIERDQAARHAERARWAAEHERKYGQRVKPLEAMPA